MLGVMLVSLKLKVEGGVYNSAFFFFFSVMWFGAQQTI
jgi:hypothetical protein